MEEPVDEPRERRRRVVRQRIWAVRLAVVAAVAVTIGVTPAELQARQRVGRRGIPALAAEHGVDLARVRVAALDAADPLLVDGVRSGALTERQRATVRRGLERALAERPAAR